MSCSASTDILLYQKHARVKELFASYFPNISILNVLKFYVIATANETGTFPLSCDKYCACYQGRDTIDRIDPNERAFGEPPATHYAKIASDTPEIWILGLEKL